MIDPSFLAEGGLVHRFRRAPRVLLRGPLLQGLGVVHAPGSSGFCFRFSTSGSAKVWLPFVGGDVVAFLSLSHLPWALYLPGELL